MVSLGVFFTLLSGIANGLFTAPMKVIPRWKWENIWMIFSLTALVTIPVALVLITVPGFRNVFASSPAAALAAAFWFGFAWGFGAICFGRSVERLGVSLANSLVIGLSSALGSLVPLFLSGALRLEPRQLVLFLGVATFIVGVAICGSAGRLRDASAPASGSSIGGYLFAIGAGILSAVFNIGYSLALPIADAGTHLGYSRFLSTNCIWLLMLLGGAIPNICYCGYLLVKQNSAGLFWGPRVSRTWGLSALMGVLWGASIFLYGAATPLLGDIGPSIGWPLSLAVALLVANLMGVLLGEWRQAGPAAVRRMWTGILILLAAIVCCALSTVLGA
jgi:L-rhamnose-H+ transport protein